MACFYMLAGLNHFVHPATYMRIMPPILPMPLTLIIISGVAEVGLGALLLVPKFRRMAAWGIIALLIAIFPANLYMYQVGGAAYDLPQWALAVRLPIQGLLILWAYAHARRPKSTALN